VQAAIERNLGPDHRAARWNRENALEMPSRVRTNSLFTSTILSNMHRFVTDPELIGAARKGDMDALDTLLRVLWPESYRLCLGIVRDVGLAEDAAQEACLRIASSIGDLRATEAFYVWFYRIVSRAAIAITKRQPSDVPLDAALDRCNDEAHAERLDVLDALASLPVPSRAATVLHYYAGLSSSEIGKILGVPAPTIRFRIMLARRALRHRLEEPKEKGHVRTEKSADAC
jgi:RNA polymerase sigma factor (sigma-70 family)